jgi:hypothetical protein
MGGLHDYLEGIPRDPGDFVTVVVAEVVKDGSLTGYLLGHRDLVRLKARLLRERRIAVADVPVAVDGFDASAAGAVAAVPTRTIALVFVSGVHDASIRAVNYARSLGALETRAVYFALDHEKVEKVIAEWFARQPGIPLDIVDAPFRDLTGPMLDEVRRYTAQPGTLVSLVIPELIPRRSAQFLLHRQTALFVKRLFLFEPNVVLTSVPYHLA